MRRVMCDRCPRECTSTHGRLMLSRSQLTSTGEMAASDDFEGIDLCDICTEVARTEWGFKISQPQYAADPEWRAPSPERAMVFAVGGGGEGTIEPARGSNGIEHYTPPEDAEVPRTLAVGMVVDRAIATRWNLWRYMEDPGTQAEDTGPLGIELCNPGS